MSKFRSMDEVIELLQDGMTIMIGGFLGVGGPNKIMDAISKTNTKDLTIICNDTAFNDIGVGKLVVNKQVKKIITSHIGTNSESGRQLNAGETEITLVPQGTLAERVRAGGSGLGGVLTPTGIGTVVEEGKEKVTVDGKEYLIETALRADLAIIFGNVVDKKGNIIYTGAARNFNPLMAMAADTVVVEAEKVVEVGEIAPEEAVTPNIFVDYIVRGE